MQDKLISTREASRILGISEKEVIDLAKANLIVHFKVAGEFFRFKKEDLIKVKPAIKKKYNISEKKQAGAQGLRDFFYFNDFYIICTIIIIALLWIIIKDIVFG